MKSPRSLLFVALLLTTLTASPLLAHGGSYRGPGGGPGPNNPQAPQPGTTPGGPFGTTTRPGFTSGVTPRAPRTARSEGFDRWEFWWAYNREPFLDLKSRLGQNDDATEPKDYRLGEAEEIVLTRPNEFEIREKLVPTLRRALSDKFFDVRAAAVIALAKVGGQADLPFIVRLLGDKNKQVRESSALALGILGEPEAIPYLVSILQDQPQGRRLLRRTSILTRTRSFAAYALGLIGRNIGEDPAIVSTLTSYARQSRKSERDISISSITALGVMRADSASPVLVQIIKETLRNDIIRSQAVVALARLEDPTHLPVLEKAARDKSIDVARSAIIGLGLLAQETNERAVKFLANTVEKGSDPQAKAWALISLGKIGGNKARMVLLRALERQQKGLKAYAALGVAIHGRNRQDSSDGKFLHEMFRNMKGDSAPAALAIALGILKYKPAKDHILDVLIGRGDPDLRGYCAVALGLMEARDTIPVIQKLLDSKVDPDFQRAAATSLGMMGDRKVVDLLTKILMKSKTEYTVSSAAQALGFVGDVTAVNPLVKTVWNEKKVADLARANATSALGTVGENEPLPVLHVFAVDSNYRALTESLRELLSIL